MSVQYIRGSPKPHQRLRSITVRLDLSQLDEAPIKFSQFGHILLQYDNIGEDAEWTEYVGYKIVGFEVEP